MVIPGDTRFLFACKKHNVLLSGEPELVHPNLEARAVWVFDTSDMSCPADEDQECANSWEVRT